MAILLHNLLARSPNLTDLAAISALFEACARVEDGPSDCSDLVGFDVLADWRRPDFNLENDAWVITTKSGQVVGYADIWMNEQCQIEMRVRVRDEYGQRGIGTLLLRLGEDHARSYARKACSHERITLSNVVSIANSHAQELLEQEGYLPVQYCPGKYVVYEKELRSSAEVSYRQALSSAA
jgi:GNAT superfamily N-acetyltransferase